MTPRGRVSVVAPVYNEIGNLPALLRSVEAQTKAPHEVIVVDGGSTDGSRAWLENYCQGRPWLRVIDNPGKTIPRAMNLGLLAAEGEYVARMDAHAEYPPGYIEGLSAVLDDDPGVVAVGAGMVTRGRTDWGKAVASVLSRPWGLGGARHRVGGASGPVSHTFSPMYRRKAALAVGGFDTGFLANEDFELDTRLGMAGGKVWLQGSVGCVWYTRDSWAPYAKQMFRYGFYKGRTLWIHPASLHARQLAPPLMILGALASLHPRLWIGRVLVASYLMVGMALGGRAATKDGTSAVRAAVATPLTHLTWGAGLLVGLARHVGAEPHLELIA